MKIQLIQAPSEGYLNFRSGHFQPIGLISIGTYLKNKDPSLEVELLDGDVLPLEEILKRISGDFIGIGVPTFSTYKHALYIAEEANKRGSTVIFGGHYASSIGKLTLRNRPFIDAVVCGDGEEAFYHYICDYPSRYIPNLIWRDGDGIVKNRVINLDLNSIPIPDRSLLNMNTYFNQFQVGLESKLTGFKKAASVYTQKGCLYATEHERCFFCARMDVGFRVRSPEIVWNEISYLQKQFGVDYIWEVSDDFCADHNWLDELRIMKPSNINANFLVFGRADKIQSKNDTRRLKETGVYEVMLGVESGNQEILNAMGKGTTLSEIETAVKLLSEEGIKVHLTFVLGAAPNETMKTIQDTYNFAQKLIGYRNTMVIAGGILVPLPRARSFSELMKINEPLRKKYEGKDIFDYDELKNAWFRQLGLDEKHVEEMANNIRELSPTSLASGFYKKTKSKPF